MCEYHILQYALYDSNFIETPVDDISLSHALVALKFNNETLYGCTIK